MANADLLNAPSSAIDYTPVAAVVAGDIIQLPDGRAGVCPTAIAAAELGAAHIEGVYTVTKTASVVILAGQPMYWDHSANSATFTPASDQDFYLGAATADATGASTSCTVNLNVWPRYKIDIHRGHDADACVAAKVETTLGEVTAWNIGGSTRLAFGTAVEAGKIDILSKQGFALGSDWIAEGLITVVDDGDDAALDVNIGVANATHATDADSITESCFIHLDGADLNIFCESDDGTTEVTATDSTVDLILGTQFHWMMDGRDPTDVQIYIDGVLVLGASTFDISAATGPLKLLAHVEKSSNNTSAEYYIDALRVRTIDV